MFLQLKYMLSIFLLYQHEQMAVYGFDKQYIGCFVDQNERTMPYERLNGGGSMTNDICVTHCCLTLDSATYSGTEASYVCFCSNVASTDNFVRRDPAGIKCDYPCDGNTTEMCGGSWSLSVYKIECSTVTTVTTITPTTSGVSTLTSKVTAKSNEENVSLSTDKQLTTNTPTISDTSTSTKELTSESTITADSPPTYKTVKTNTPTTNDIYTLTSKVSTESTETDNSPSTETTTNIPTIIEISKLPPELTTEATIEGNSPSTERTLTTYTRTTNDISTRTLKVSTESTERGKSSSTETTTNAPTAIDISTSTTKQSNSPSATYIQELPVDATEGSNNCMCPCGNVLSFDITLWKEEELVKRLKLLKSLISVNKKDTNRYKGTKTSAYDPRKSSRNIGLCGVIVLVVPVIFVVVIDIQRICK